MKEVINFLVSDIKLKNSDTIILGNSAGPDSMCLFDILLKLRDKYKFNIVCAHVNHNVRKESLKEKEFLMRYCYERNITFETMTIEKYGDDNFHNQARKIRYNFFYDLVRKYDANYLMTAHHGDDLIETILMRIVRGSTLKGYSGFSKVVVNDDFKIVRPLIYITKDDILDYNKVNNIPYVLDSSNFKDKYTRNRYRMNILPFLKKEDLKVHDKFIKFSETLEEYDEFINREINKKINKVYHDGKINIVLYKQLDYLIQKKIIYFILEQIYKDDLMTINDKHVRLIMNLLNSKKANAKLCLPRNIEVYKYYEYLEFSKEIKEIVNYEMELIKFAVLPNGHKLEIIDKIDSNNNNVCRIDSSEISLPLYIRTRKLGDKMFLKKLNGYKKVKDIFIDCKVPVKERDKWPIVVDSQDRIIWMPGLKKSKFTKLKNEKYDIIIKYS